MDQCVEDLIADYISIKYPGELYAVVNDLKDFIQKGILREISGTCSIYDITEGHTWPADIISIQFETINGVKYILSCETYHGFGGAFKREGQDQCNPMKGGL